MVICTESCLPGERSARRIIGGRPALFIPATRGVPLRSSAAEPGDPLLDRFLPPVSAWFRETLGTPTPPQRLGWPAIAAGRNTLIVAPTGSGKTLAAFLAAL